MHGSVYVCASVYRCMCECLEVDMYVRVFISVYAWKCICMCECLEVDMYVRVFISVYAWKCICMCECL